MPSSAAVPSSSPPPSPFLIALARRLEAQGAVIFGRDEGCQFSDSMRRDWGSLLGDGTESSSSPPAAAGGGAVSGKGLSVPPAFPPPIAYVACDADAESERLCSAAGITMTPTLVLGGGTRLSGYASPARIAEALNHSAGLVKVLGELGFVFLGRQGCEWTRRQQQALGEEGRGLFLMCRPEDTAAATTASRASKSYSFFGGSSTTTTAKGGASAPSASAPADACRGLLATPAILFSSRDARPLYGFRKLGELGELASADGAAWGAAVSKRLEELQSGGEAKEEEPRHKKLALTLMTAPIGSGSTAGGASSAPLR